MRSPRTVIAAAVKSPRNILLVAFLVLAAGSAILAHLFNLAASRHLDQVQRELGQLLGLDVRFTSLEVHLFGRPGFAAKDLRIADDPRFAATPILGARELVLGVRLWPLLGGRVIVDSLTLRQPEFQIITDETGLLNLDLLTQRRKQSPPGSQLRPVPFERKTSSVSFAIDELRIDDGRVIYLDRSVREAAEFQLADIDLTVRGLETKSTTRIQVAAALAEGLGQDLHLNGEFSAGTEEQSWLRRELSLTVRSDSLPASTLARAVTALRDRIPREIEITGPMSFQARVTGTLAEPRFEEITLRAPLFGASDDNATLTGDLRFSERRSWEDAELSGKLIVDPLPLDRLRALPWFRHNFSPALVSEGAVGVYARFEGRWQELRIGALVRADRSQWKYQNWLRKPIKRPAEIRARVARRKDKLFIHESEFVSGANRIGFLGFIDVGAEPKLQLRLYSRQGRLQEWREMILPDLLSGAAGQTDLNVIIDRNLLPEDGRWSVNGYLKLTDGEIKPDKNRRAVESVHGTINFKGRQASIDDGRFRLGASAFALDGIVANILDPEARYRLRAAQLNLADLDLLAGGPAIQLKNFNAKGKVHFDNGALLLDGAALAAGGRLADIDFQKMSADFDWSANGLTLRNLSLRALDGSLRAEGYLASGGANSAPVELSAQAEAIAMRALLGHVIPNAQDRVQGQLDGRGRFVLNSTPGAKGQSALEGSGEAIVQTGLIKDFNLVSQLLLRGSGAAVSAQSAARLPPGFAKLLSRADTPFDSLKADFVVEPARIRTDNLVIQTPDYSITGAGWVGFDRTTRWNGMIVLSPRLTQEVQRDMRLLRYLLDRRGRLAITFRVDGTIPNVRIRLDNRSLAQTLRGGTVARDGERESADRPSQESGGDKKWLPDAVERFLNR